MSHLAHLRWYEWTAVLFAVGLAVRVNLPRVFWHGVIEPSTPWLFPLLCIFAVSFLCYALVWHYDRRLSAE